MDKSNLDIFVVDAGAHSFRAGRAEDFPTDSSTPHVVLQSAVRAVGADDADSAQTSTHQIFDGNGCISNWDGYEAMLSYVFYKQLGWPVGDEGYLLATANTATLRRADRDRLTQILFETFNLRGLYLLDSCTACVYTAGKLSGVAVDIGHTGVTVGQVSEGALVPGSVVRLPGGGASLDALLTHELAKRDIRLKASSIAALKEKCANVAESAAAFATMRGAENPEATEFELPDGQKIGIGIEGHLLGECLANPTMSPLAPCQDTERALGLAEAAFSCATNGTDAPMRQAMLNSIVLAGGPACVPNLHMRVMSDLRALLPATANVSMLKVPEYMPTRSAKHAAYVGGAIVAKSLNANNMMTKEDYSERGPAYINSKC